MTCSRVLRLAAPSILFGLLFSLGLSMPAQAAAAIDGKALNILWVLPFAGILLSIALMPLFTPSFWHHHYGKVAAFWSLCVIVPFAL